MVSHWLPSLLASQVLQVSTSPVRAGQLVAFTNLEPAVERAPGLQLACKGPQVSLAVVEQVSVLVPAQVATIQRAPLAS